MSLVPEGIQTVRARNWTFKRKKDGGWFLSITCMTEGGPPGLEPGKVSWSLFFDGWQAGVSLRALREMGCTSEDLVDCHDNGGDLDRNTVQVVVVHKRLGDNIIAVVDRILFPDDEMRQALRDFFHGMKVPPPRNSDSSDGGSGSHGNNL